MDEDLAGLQRDVERDPGDAAAWLRLAQAHARAGAPEAALEAAQRALAVEPALDEARALARRAYVEVTAEVEPPGLPDAIGRALGRDRPWTEPAGWDDAQLLGGAVHAASGAVAWIEDLQRVRAGVDESRVTLHVARAGREVLTWALAHADPGAGTLLHHVHVDAARVTLVYQEKHHDLAAVVPLAGPPTVLAIDWPRLVVGDQVLFRSPERGLLEVRSLPDLAPALPLPTPGPVDVLNDRPLRLDAGALVVLGPSSAPGAPTPEHTLSFPPGPPAPLLDRGAARNLALAGPLLGAPQPEADLLLGATCHAFWLDTRQPSTDDPDARVRWNSPGWLPLYWHREQVRSGDDAQAARLVGLLERLAGGEVPGDHAPDARLARHLAWRAAELLAALRAGHLPPGVSCELWATWSVEAFTPWLERFPPGFVQVFQALRATRPERLPTRRDVDLDDADRDFLERLPS